eukprot:3786950-Prymnesium_polylepis.3
MRRCTAYACRRLHLEANLLVVGALALEPRPNLHRGRQLRMARDVDVSPCLLQRVPEAEITQRHERWIPTGIDARLRLLGVSRRGSIERTLPRMLITTQVRGAPGSSRSGVAAARHVRLVDRRDCRIAAVLAAGVASLLLRRRLPPRWAPPLRVQRVAGAVLPLLRLPAREAQALPSVLVRVNAPRVEMRVKQRVKVVCFGSRRHASLHVESRGCMGLCHQGGRNGLGGGGLWPMMRRVAVAGATRAL